MILFLLLKYQKSCLSLLHFSAMDALENALVQQLTHVAIQQIFHHCKLLYESVMILFLLLKYQKSCLSLLYFSAMGALENALVQQLAHVAMDIGDISLLLLLKYQKSCLWVCFICDERTYKRYGSTAGVCRHFIYSFLMPTIFYDFFFSIYYMSYL